MQRKVTYLIARHPFFLSFLLHLILLFVFIWLTLRPGIKRFKREPEPEIYVPAQFINPMRPSMLQRATPRKNILADKEALQAFKDKVVEKTGLEALAQPKLAQQPFKPAYQKQVQERQDPVHVIGEKLMEDPLRKLLGIALTKHLIYPKAAEQLRMRGVVSVDLVLHPDGRITDIRLAKSSKENLLDVITLNAIQDMSPVANIDLYVKEDKAMTFNVIFH
jgi:TonB family protein